MFTIKLVRHGQSAANAGDVCPQAVGDHTIGLTPAGREQALAAGRGIGSAFLADALLYCSPYRRTRETLAGLLEGAGVDPAGRRVYEDPRLRELDHGYGDREAQQELRRTHGWFFYRYAGGESPADCFDRTSTFLESLVRQAARKKVRRVLVVTHGITIRCFVMRFLHLTVEDYDRMLNPGNCDVVTVAPRGELAGPQFTSGTWGVVGLRLEPDPPPAA